ncbi:MAG TPA: hypothetical protein VF119_05305 [Candidatus Limnocylindrales bacterium]
MNRVSRPILAFVLLAAAVAACSGGGATPSGVATIDDPAASTAPDASGAPAASVSPEDAMLAFARCMREHGVDMPDPVVNADGGMTVSIGSEGGKPIDRKTMQAADEACKHLMPARPDGGPSQLTPEQQDAMLDFAKCMREHGVDMPDPEFGNGGGAVMIGGDGIAFDSPTFKAADEACRSIMTDAMPGLVGGGAGGPSVSGSGPDSGGTTNSGPGFRVEPAQ